jgi:DinB superfamily
MLYTRLMDELSGSRARLMEVVSESERRPASVDPHAAAGEEHWSVSQVLEHIQLVDFNVARLLGRLSSRARDRDRLSPADMVNVPVNTRLSQGIPRYDAVPAFPGTEPTGGFSLSEIRDSLEDSRTQLMDLVAVGREFDCSKLVAPHPTVGRLNYYEWIYLVVEHDRLHTGQIESTP